MSYTLKTAPRTFLYFFNSSVHSPQYNTPGFIWSNVPRLRTFFQSLYRGILCTEEPRYIFQIYVRSHSTFFKSMYWASVHVFNLCTVAQYIFWFFPRYIFPPYIFPQYKKACYYLCTVLWVHQTTLDFVLKWLKVFWTTIHNFRVCGIRILRFYGQQI